MSTDSEPRDLPRLFDTHCHVVAPVFDGDTGVDATLQRARDHGVARFLVIGSGYGADSAPPAVAVAERHADAWASAGLHPHDASAWDAALEARLQAWLGHPRVVAVGETGLDYFYDQSPRNQQRAAFRAQARMALEHDLPLIVHDRDSGGEALSILRQEGAFDGAGVLWHCFTGDRELMRAIVDAGGHISLSGIVTFKTAPELRAVAAEVPDDRLLVETDAPWLAPVPVRGKRNEPAYVRHVAAVVAAQRGVDPVDLARTTWANASRLFGLDPAL